MGDGLFRRWLAGRYGEAAVAAMTWLSMMLAFGSTALVLSAFATVLHMLGIG